jgi:hypothetical protein
MEAFATEIAWNNFTYWYLHFLICNLWLYSNTSRVQVTAVSLFVHYTSAVQYILLIYILLHITLISDLHSHISIAYGLSTFMQNIFLSYRRLSVPGFISCHQNAGQNQNIKIANESLKKCGRVRMVSNDESKWHSWERLNSPSGNMT